MPDLVKLMIQHRKDMDVNHDIRTSKSVVVTGIPRQGKYTQTPLVVYAHAPTSLFQPEYIKSEVRAGFTSSGRLPQSEFQNLVDSDSTMSEGIRLISVIPYEELKERQKNTDIYDNPFNNPQVVSFIGNESLAEKLLRIPLTHLRPTKRNMEFAYCCVKVPEIYEVQNIPMGRLLSIYSSRDYVNLCTTNLRGVSRVIGRSDFDGFMNPKPRNPTLDEMVNEY